ncbi:hypothetical protein FNO01nite_02410 [Flavobacterium noncentrifugens]|uniref:DUF2797 domain-containing protein n=1 Tax=Flavobacterium noncentrifugens TaxID=1128970 RepID=A0A1G8RUY0_9FLAO|nr:DUF2797 domain-containing protein [Flavobacterium noncentrifugens]GEP49569.1 hypothetical protein FNO01nite_02410 [Flavobacterium noncentrifugens]SDJ20140.1 Protein of unknown function [Flavobacterium noncentrifugens]
MLYEGTLSKMETEFGYPIQYYLVFESSFLNVNQLLGKEVEISFRGYQCLNCSKKKKIYRQGFCYDCFYSSPAVGDWIMRPELSTAHLGIADRDLDYETRVQLTPHVVYLALSSDVKVGVTRKTQVPTRWIDQGACQAVSVVEVPNRYLAGITEVALKDHFVDKTNWRKMLQNEVLDLDLLTEKTRIFEFLPEEVQPYFNAELDEHLILNYPVIEHPKKVTGLNLDKTPNFKGKLIGIKGQYLIFHDGTVFNVRSFEGYVVAINV